MSENQKNNPFASPGGTQTRLRPLSESGLVVVVTKAYGPDGEDLIDYDGPEFSGYKGVKLLVKQGDRQDTVLLSPYFGDPSKLCDTEFEDGVPCELFCPGSGRPLDKIPGMSTEDGGEYYAIYLTPDLENGELVAINNIWGNTNSRILSEDEVLLLFAESEGAGS